MSEAKITIRATLIHTVAKRVRLGRLLLALVLAAVPMSATAQIVTDNFNRANSTGLGTDWTQSGDGRLDIVSNQAQVGISDFSFGRFTGAGWTGGADQYAQAKIVTLQSGRDMGPVVRGGGTSNATLSGYFFVLNEPDAAVSLGSTIQTRIYKATAGAASFTPLGPGNVGVVINSGDIAYLEVQGSSPATLVAKIGTTTIITLTDSSIGSGSPGIYVSSGSTGTWDDFAAGAVQRNGCGTLLLLGVGCEHLR
jgi:hypothetical protein